LAKRGLAHARHGAAVGPAAAGAATVLSTEQAPCRGRSTAWAGPQLGAATASSLDGSESRGACEDAGVDSCQVTVTGPVSFDLRP
jgi:hypothetical protein